MKSFTNKNDLAGRHVSEARIKECLPPPSPDSLILMCGPLQAQFSGAKRRAGMDFSAHTHTIEEPRPPMIEFACKKNLEANGIRQSLPTQYQPWSCAESFPSSDCFGGLWPCGSRGIN